MPINFKTLLKAPPCWVRGTRDDDDTVLTTAVRMVRNLPGHCFPGWSTAEDRAAVANEILPVLSSHPRFRSCHRAEMTELNYRERCILLERKQITPGMAARRDGCHLLISRDQEIFAMVNEEEHLCVHVAAPGFDVKRVMDTAADIARHLERKLHFASNAQNGYLTSLPQESGEGLQLFAVLHLPTLSMTGSMEKVNRAMEQLHLNIAPFTGDAEDCSHLYVIYTCPFPTGGTTVMTEHFSDLCRILAMKELRMGDLEFEREDGPDPVDIIYRSYGLLSYAYALDYRELLGALSLIRLGLQRYLLISNAEGENKFIMPKEVLRLYELSPATLRHLNKNAKTVRDLQALRGDKVREALKLLTPLLPL